MVIKNFPTDTALKSIKKISNTKDQYFLDIQPNQSKK